MKRYKLFSVTIAFFSVVASVTLGFTLVAQAGAYGKRPLGIVSALSDELALIRDAMENEGKVRVVEEGQWTFYVGRLHDVKVVTFFCGEGKVNAAAGTELLIQRFDVRGIVFSGVSGGVAEFTDIGDITISSEAAHHDYGTVIPIGGLPDVNYPEITDLDRGFVPMGVPIYKGGVMERKTFFEAEPDFIDFALQASEEIVFEPIPGTDRLPVVSVGIIMTGDQFIASTHKSEWLFQAFSVLSTEMEGAAVAQVAYIHDIPWVIIRTNSDLADDLSGDITNELWQYATETSAKLVVKMVELLAEEKKAY
jgi:adenosylhomocysteine nucleosidase